MKAVDMLPRLIDRQVMGVLDPELIDLLRDYLSLMKVVPWGDQFVMGTHAPPFPGPAFDRFMNGLIPDGSDDGPTVTTTALAITNRCPLTCWHCYNAGRPQIDLPLEDLKHIVAQFQDIGAASIVLTGGEPLIRPDLEDLCAAIDEDSVILLNTAGTGMDAARARSLKDAGVWSVGVSLDSISPDEHNRLRGSPAAFDNAVAAIGHVRDAGMYPYVIGVMRDGFLEEERFVNYLLKAQEFGAREVHLLDPAPSGRLVGRDVPEPTDDLRARQFAYQRMAAEHEDWPILSFASLFESQEWFGCAAGRGFIYVDGAGNVCPCYVAPISFGNALEEPLAEIIERVVDHVGHPRSRCLSHVLKDDITAAASAGLPLGPATSCAICLRRLGPDRAPGGVSRLETILRRMDDRLVGVAELEAGYTASAGTYDERWLTRAGVAVDRLMDLMDFQPGARVLDAGCGTGFTTRRVAQAVGPTGLVKGVDISDGMLAEARRRAEAEGLANCEFDRGELIETMAAEEPGSHDACTSTWVLGYVSLKDFAARAAHVLRPGGRVGIVCNAAYSPGEVMGVVMRMLARHPFALRRAVNFPFPSSRRAIRKTLIKAGFDEPVLETGAFTMHYDSGRDFLDQLERSGEAEVYRQCIDPKHIDELLAEFVTRIETACRTPDGILITYEYFVITADRVQ